MSVTFRKVDQKGLVSIFIAQAQGHPRRILRESREVYTFAVKCRP
jgi:hypothetical protein